jgi:hypothetical protein
VRSVQQKPKRGDRPLPRKPNGDLRLARLEQKLDHVTALLGKHAGTLKALQRQGRTLMTRADEFATILSSINDETNRIAALIESLIQQQAGGGLTDAEEVAIRDQFQAAADALKAVGAPTTPTP